MTATTPTDARRARGARTRAVVVEAAVALASVDGLDGLTLGRLAERLGVSKSGLFTHWRDKESLQLAVVDRAGAQWEEEVVAPALRLPRGLPRLFAVHEARLDFYAREVLPGGCFFATVQHELDGRPGPVHDLVAQHLARWTAFLAAQVEDAVARGQLPPDTDPEQLAFEIDALGEAAVPRASFFGAEPVLARSRRAVLGRLRAAAAAAGADAARLLPAE